MPHQTDTCNYPNSWYPVCRSSELKAGQVKPVTLMGRKSALFRTLNNQLGLLDARCCHIGADLSKGWVKGERLICPLHHWAFDTEGKCQNIPCQQDIPSRLKQSAMNCCEHYGVIYAFLGDAPSFEPPHFDGITESVFSPARIIDFDAPYEMASVNSFDEQHLATVHRREVLGKQEIFSHSPFHFAIEYRARITPHTVYDKILHLIGKEQVHMRLDCWGGNLLLFSHLGTANHMIISLLPLETHRARAFISTVLAKGKHPLSPAKQWLFSRVLNTFTMMFVQQDVRALQGIDFKLINVLPKADATMIQWYQYWKKLPRIES